MRSFLGLGLLGAACASSSVATKPTPFGERPVQCVLEVPSGVVQPEGGVRGRCAASR